MTNDKFSFLLGFGQILNKDSKAVKCEIMDTLNIKSRGSWLRRLRGEVEPTITEVERITAIFERYSVVDVWGKSCEKE